jgi:glycosyltransferase involved in cell wall biosynthesis
MRVLMVAERLPPAIGGVERHVAGLVRELAKRGCEVTAVAPAHMQGLAEEQNVDGARVLRLSRTGRRRRDYLRAWRWWAEHQSLLAEADLVHFHSVYALLHWFGPARLLCPGKQFYLTYHGYEMRFPVPHRARLYRWLAERWVGGSICVGHYLIKWFHLQPQAVTYGAVTVPSGLFASPAEPHAVFVGRLSPDTGLDIYLRGLGLLRRQYHLTLPLIVCGDGPSRSELEKLARNEGVEANFVGFVPQPTHYLSQASIALVSGYLAMLEAMAHRRPVFSVYHTPVKADYLRMVPGAEQMFTIADHPEGLAAQLAALLSGQHDPSEQVEQAYEFAARHSWAQLAEMYIRLWDLLLPASRGCILPTSQEVA